ncbi:MAG: alpha/beta hydrolase [SAR86 cluster bacterium]|uniref:Alpha/beta hydrolase n=1 Tax=SAR86 cluster bacterium TaxID=2030880 RepID=A0A2A5CF49_9GAMM|nr:alpha/beta hydrolase [Gammaproteobacteria bacterium AH-315-E17]PCJ42524.1 MAG: alpha/beta hydrolase [SAR86 cluster bacterium]
MTAVDPQTQALLDQMNAEGNPQLYELSVEDARAGLKQMTLQMDTAFCEVRERRELTIPGPVGEIPVRIYWPELAENNTEENKSLAILLLFHGGGFALADMDTHENMARYYCKNAGLIVINVGYRLSPEYKFPTGVEDCYAALCWAAENAQELGGDPKRIAVTGDSAGGNFSAVVCQMSLSRQGPQVAYQLLAYPVTNMDKDANYESREAFGQGEYFLSKMDVSWICDMYFTNPDDEKKNLLASPVLREDLSGLPPALVITAGYDLLRDEGKHYADRLEAAGVKVEHVRFESTVHGFMSFSGALDAGKEALALAVKKLKENLGA